MMWGLHGYEQQMTGAQMLVHMVGEGGRCDWFDNLCERLLAVHEGRNAG